MSGISVTVFYGTKKSEQKLCSDPYPKSGEPAGARTPDHRLKRAMLYRLSYRPTLVFETIFTLHAI